MTKKLVYTFGDVTSDEFEQLEELGRQIIERRPELPPVTVDVAAIVSARQNRNFLADEYRAEYAEYIKETNRYIRSGGKKIGDFWPRHDILPVLMPKAAR